MGFQREFHIKSMFIGQNKYMCGWLEGHMDTINTLTQSRFVLTAGSLVFEVEVEVDVEDDVG